MIIKGKNVIGLKVVTIDTGTVIQTVDDIAYDPTDHRITALLVDSGGLFSSAKAIHIDDVRNIGEDAVIVHDESAIQSTKNLSSDVRSISDSNKHLVKTNVLTIDGKELGKVTDIFFDSETGYVETMEVSQGGLKTMTEGKKSIKPSDIVTIGADATIVSTYTEAVLEQQGEEGGLKGAINDAKAKTEEFAEQAKDSIQNATDKATVVAKDVASDVKEKSIDLKDKAAIKADELRDATEANVAKARVRAEELRDDAAKRGDELIDVARGKSDDLKVVAAEKRDEMQANVEKLSDDLTEKSKEIRSATSDKARQVKEDVDDAAAKVDSEVRRTTEVVKAKTNDAVEDARRTGVEVVEKATEHYEDAEKIIDKKQTSVKQRS